MQLQAIRTLTSDAAPLSGISLPAFDEHGLSADVLRLDLIHPVVSGNKAYKLRFYLEEAIRNGNETILTWGGAYSNHLVAAAFVAWENGLRSIGIIRGDSPPQWSQSLKAAAAYGMQLHFVTRAEYKRLYAPERLDSLRHRFPDALIIPGGGSGERGIMGASRILSGIQLENYTHILCAVGTGTTFLGLVRAALPHQSILGFPVLKGVQDLSTDLLKQCAANRKDVRGIIHDAYHFGGYAKKNHDLIHFMNSVFRQTGIPLDFVYTAKMFYGAADLAAKKYFPSKSRILLVHSGGLQGNLSLPEGTLVY